MMLTAVVTTDHPNTSERADELVSQLAGLHPAACSRSGCLAVILTLPAPDLTTAAEAAVAAVTRAGLKPTAVTVQPESWDL